MSKRKLPSTSIEAYRSLDPFQLAEIYRKIMLALVKIGEGTTQEIAASAKEDHSRIWKRVSELGRMGIIYRPGNKKMMRSGRMAYTWMLTLEGVPKTDTAEKALKGKPTVQDHSRNIQSISEQTKLFLDTL